MIFKDIDQITEEDLRTLIANSVAERKTLEYKQTLPGNSDPEKKEFLADVSSFANASGGDIIYGIIEDRNTGFPIELKGINIENSGQEIIRLESSIRDGIEPRVSGIGTRPIELSNGQTVLVVRIPKSWIPPHRVVFKGHNKFYSRGTNGKYQMDVTELRNAFNLSTSLTEKIRKFREDRISKILANETPAPLSAKAKIVLHLIPVVSFNPAQTYEIHRTESDKLHPIGDSGGSRRYNFDGLLAHSSMQDGKTSAYTQFFKNGIIEAVEESLLDSKYPDGRHYIPSVLFEKELIDSLSNYLAVFKGLSVSLPIFLFLSLLQVKEYSLAVNPRKTNKIRVDLIDRDILCVPEEVIESYDMTSSNILRPCFDSIWNASGFPKSLNYNDAGEWAG
ncbi:MAG: ATP-binding protein [Candidatus Ratteibacteria bacterium]|jgi:hypothetical protein